MTDANLSQPDIECDFRTLRCPNLLITVIKEIENAQAGQVLRILAGDLNAPSSISSWTRQSGHSLLDMYQEGEDFVFLIECRPSTIDDHQLTVKNHQPTAN